MEKNHQEKKQIKLDRLEYIVYNLLKKGGRQSQMNDIIEYLISLMICLNVVVIVGESVELDLKFGLIIKALRVMFFVFFLIEYVLRVWIADIVMHDRKHPIISRLKYMLSFWAILDLLALFPDLLGSTIIDFRIFRVLRLLRITQLKGLYRYSNILSRVMKKKGAQLLSALFIVLIFMIAAAVVIYDLEHVAQPDVFKNVLAGLWWSISAVTTIGYGDSYPITALGKIFASCISIFGVFLMAVPIGILTAGFFEVSKSMDGEEEDDDTAQ